MHKTTIYLDDEIYQQIRTLADASDATQAAIIRRALDAFFGGIRPKPRSIGLGRSGVGTLSERTEELLAGMGEDS